MFLSTFRKFSLTLAPAALLSAAIATAQTPPPLPPGPAPANAPGSAAPPTGLIVVPKLDERASQPQRVDVVYYKQPQKKITYMGIGIEPPTETLRSQLKLPEGTGVVVNYVDPNGAANTLIHAHDVLQKLDDQILINAEQFQALVRLHKPGDRVHVTLVREAGTVSVDVPLAEKEIEAATSTLNLIYDSRVTNFTNAAMGAAGGELGVTWGTLTGPTTAPAAFSSLGMMSRASTALGAGGGAPLAQTSIDAAIAHLGTMVPSTQPADRATVIRRLALDLTGAPPSPEEINAFVGDKSPDAYEKMVQRLLANAPPTFVQPEGSISIPGATRPTVPGQPTR